MFFCNHPPHIPQYMIPLLIGFVICSIAIVTPAWQVTVVPELNMTVQNGLWMSCQKRMHGIFVCLYSFADQDDYNKTAIRELSVFSPVFAGYQHFVLAIFVCAQVLVFLCIALYFLSRYVTLHPYTTFVYDVSITVAVILCTVGCIVFAIYTHLEKYNTFDGETSTHQFKLQLRMWRSISFYLMIVGALFYFAAFVCSITHRIHAQRRSRILPKFLYSPEARRVVRKITLDSTTGRQMVDDDEDMSSRPTVRKVTPHPRQNSIISTT